jgi:hypothetical protein
MTHQKINASHLAFLQAWNEEIDFLIYLKLRILFCRWNLKQAIFFKKKTTNSSAPQEKLPAMATCAGLHRMCGCGLAMNLITNCLVLDLLSVCSLVVVLVHL